jgi:hypothetical protein
LISLGKIKPTGESYTEIVIVSQIFRAMKGVEPPIPGGVIPEMPAAALCL